MTAYYNEIDDFAADWLENLIAANLIAPGDVDRRSIEEVQADDLRGYTQCHFFAGIGVWSYGLRRAGWDDDRPIWTGSCPCPPFSSAGKQKACPECGGFGPVPHVARTGVFVCCHCEHEWYADGRHLWPEFARLIWERRPGVVLGEQVASADGRIWVDLVCSSLEIMGYTAGAVDTSSAIHGAPHIRQRLRFAAHDPRSSAGGVGNSALRGESRGIRERESSEWPAVEDRGRSATGRMADADDRRERLVGGSRGQMDKGCEGDSSHGPELCSATRGMDNATSTRHLGEVSDPEGNPRDETRMRLPDAGLSTRGMADAERGTTERFGYEVAGTSGSLQGETREQRIRNDSGDAGDRLGARTNPPHVDWRDADWLLCRDGKWRPVEPGTFPLAHGASARVGRLRAYGNAVEAEATTRFIEAVMESL